MISFGTAFGFVSALVIVILTINLSLPSFSGVFDLSSIIIVIGGTLASTFISFPSKKILVLLKVFLMRVFGLSKQNFPGIIKEIGELNDAYLKGKRIFENRMNQINDPFLKDAASALFWLESDVNQEQLRELLEQRAETFYERYMSESKIFGTIAKYPPAFGMMGTTIGMVALLQSLGSEGGKENIGPSMAVALITTLYGIAISNMMLIPIAENLKQKTLEDDRARRIIVEGILLLEKRTPTKFVMEKLNSYLLPSERVE